jgi:TatD DNase family protein
LRETAALVPVERLLVETDAPFLAPVPHRGKTNEPAFVADTLRLLAEVKGMTPEALAEATTANALRLFDKMPPLAA